MNRLVFATGNSGKVKEVIDFINLSSINLVSLTELENYPFPDAVEDGNSFLENAQKKARHYFHLINEPIIADDSGLVVNALNGEPGIFSARYAGPNATDEQNNIFLLDKLKSANTMDWEAYFIAVIVYKDQYQEVVFEGKSWGRIIENPQGNKGFGYDPIFYINELQKTYAQMEPFEKNKYSHRGKAVEALKKFLINSNK